MARFEEGKDFVDWLLFLICCCLSRAELYMQQRVDRRHFNWQSVLASSMVWTAGMGFQMSGIIGWLTLLVGSKFS